MYIYVAKKIDKPMYIHFLCGNKYSEKTLVYDNINMINKRKVLYDYLQTLGNHYPIILEKFFNLEEYEVNYMGNLKEIELMMSYIASSVIILQETFSTSAEIGVFGSFDELANKTLIIYPTNVGRNQDYVGTFIKEAFLNDNIKNYGYDFKYKKFGV